MKAVQIH